MTRKEIGEILGVPPSSLSDWSKKDISNWRRKLYIVLTNLSYAQTEKLLEMGEIKKMTLEEMDEKIHLFLEVGDK